jgi:hypothetical protein
MFEVDLLHRVSFVLPAASPVRLRGAISDVIDADVRGREVLLLLGIFLQDALRHEVHKDFASSKRPHYFGPCKTKAGHRKPSFQRCF